MNGGKRSRTRSSKNDSDCNENHCPNATKRMKIEEVAPLKPKETKSETERFSFDQSIKEDVMEEMGINAIIEEDSYVTSSDTETTTTMSTPEEAPKKLKFENDKDQSYSDSPTMKMLVTPENKTSDFMIARRQNYADGKNHFSRLSDELLLMIFHWLPKPVLCKAALVCKQWRQISYDDSFWARLELGGRTLRARNLEHVLKRGVTTLRLAGSQLPDPVIKPKSSFLPPNFVSKLQFLDLTMAQISQNGLYELLHTCRNLRKLSLENCKLSGAVCEAVGHNAALDCLDLSSCEGLTSNGLEAILACCTSLKSLNLAWTCMDADTIETLTTTLPKSVQRLNIAGCRKSITDEHVKKVVAACPDLVELDLSDCTILTGATLSCIATGLESLEHLSLSRCYAITPADFERVNESYSLVYLDIYGVLNEALLAVLRVNLPGVFINKFRFSSIARPTVGVRRTSIWGMRVRD